MDTHPLTATDRDQNYFPWMADDGGPDQSNPTKSGYSIFEDDDAESAPPERPQDDAAKGAPDQSNPPESDASTTD